MKDSGEREKFDTGAQRDIRRGKGRYDLVPREFIHATAEVLEEGAIKYEERNWEKGIRLSRSFDSLVRHLYQWLDGQDDEPHLKHAAANLAFIIATEARALKGLLPRELIDVGPNRQAKQPEKPAPVVSTTALAEAWMKITSEASRPAPVAAEGLLPDDWNGTIWYWAEEKDFQAEVSHRRDLNIPWFRARASTPKEAWEKAIQAAQASPHWPTQAATGAAHNSTPEGV